MSLSPARCTALLTSCLLAACSTQTLPVPGAVPADLDVAADLAGLSLHVRWSFVFNDRAADCAASGVASVGFRAWKDTGPFVTWPCAAGEGTTALPMGRGGIAAVALDGAGVPLSYRNLNEETWYQPGVHDLTFPISDEPVPQLRRLFESVAAWHQSHGNTFPPAGDWTPLGPGRCCAWPYAVCPANVERWESSPWSDLGFSINHGFRYSYWFMPSAGPPASFVVRAGADLNCEGLRISDYRITGTWNGKAFVGEDAVEVINAGE